MKKILCTLLIFMLILPLFSMNPEASEQIVMYIGSNKVIVNNNLSELDENPLIVPITINSTTFVPVRFIAEKLNMKVEFDEKTETIKLNGNNMVVSFTINSNKININGKDSLINTENDKTVTIIHKDRTYLPIRAISEAVGKQVFYDRGLIIIGDNALSYNATNDKSKIDEMIGQLSTMLIVGDIDNLKSLIVNNYNDNYLYKGNALGVGGAITVTDSVSGNSGSATPPPPNVTATPAPSAPMAEDSKSVSNDDYSKTNTQVAGVDEADVVKTDGKFIYQVNGSRIIIASINPVEQMSVTGIIKDDTRNFNPIEMYVDGDKLTVISNVTNDKPVVYDSAAPANKRVIGIAPMPPYRHINTYVQCTVYDISNRAKPILDRVFEIEGNYISSRKIDNIVYIVTNKNAYYINNPNNKQTGSPLVKDSSLVDKYNEIPLTEIRYFPNFRDNNYTTISSLDINKPNQQANVNTFLGAGQNIYVSKENMYIATNTYSTEASTLVYKFSLNNGIIIYLAKESVPGTIINQFSMDEYKGNFRIATSGYSNNQQSNNLFILDSKMQKRGSITGIAPGEHIYSTRFMGDRGYMVTFKNVDPLFVLDLSSIDNPKILGKLKIPGYSNYLHPVDENHILGFGKDTEEYGNSAYYQGMKMALFDITDVENPKEKFVELIGDRGTDSELLRNHKALLYDEKNKILAFPVTVNTINNEKKSATQYGSFEFNGAYVYNFSIENGFALKGKITHLTKEDYLKSGDYYYGGKGIDRILYANGNLFTTSKLSIQAHSADKIEFIKSIDISK